MQSEDDVRRMCLSFPGITERLSWGNPAWFARTLMARIWEDGVLTVKTRERDALAGTSPDIFFWTPHHERSPELMLVRLDQISAEELAELLDDSYRIASTVRNVRPLIQPPMHDLQPHQPLNRMVKVSGIVARISKPRDCHCRTALTLEAMTALNTIAR